MGIEVISEEPYATRDICDTCGCVIADGELDETCIGEAYSLHNTQSQCLAAVTAERDELKALLSAKGQLIARIERKRAVAQEIETVKAERDALKMKCEAKSKRLEWTLDNSAKIFYEQLDSLKVERDAALGRLVDVFHHNSALLYELQMLENLSPDLLEGWEDRVSKTANKIKQAAKEKEATE